MIAFDNNLLSDYLNGEESAEEFLTQYENEAWAVASITVYEACMGVVYGYIDATLGELCEAIGAFEELPITAATAFEAARLQGTVMENGIQLGPVDALVAASADEAGATLATNDGTLRKPEVAEHVAIAHYHR